MHDLDGHPDPVHDSEAGGDVAVEQDSEPVVTVETTLLFSFQGLPSSTDRSSLKGSGSTEPPPANQKELHAANLAIDQTIAALEKGEIAPRELPKALRDLKLSFGIGTDKANVLMDRPTAAVEHTVNMPQIDAAIAALLGRGAVVDAEVVEPAELAEGDAA